MPTDEVLFAIGWRVVLVVAALVNLRMAFGRWRDTGAFADFRSFIAFLAMTFGVIALLGAGRVLGEAYPDVLPLLRIVGTVGVAGFLVGLLATAVSWPMKR